MAIQFPVKEFEQFLPAIIATLYAIHQVDVSQSKNFGIFNEQGVGLFPDWRSSLAWVKDEEEDWDYYGKWHHLFIEMYLITFVGYIMN